MARPTKLTDELCDEICRNIREGIPEGTAAQLAGISNRTLINWKNRAKESKRKNRYTEFFHKLKVAKAYGAKKHLKAMMESKDWKARKYLLSFFDNIYEDGETIKLEHSGELKGKVEVSIHEFNRVMDEGLKKLKENDD